MSVLTSSWRCSLIAAALFALLGNSPAPAKADDNPPPPTAAEREKMGEKFRAIREKAAQLDLQGKYEEADQLRREAKAMMIKAQGDSGYLTITATAVPIPRGTNKVADQIQDLFERIVQLEKQGKHDEAQHLRQEARELYSKLNPHSPPTAPAPTTADQARQKAIGQFREMREMIEKANQLQKEGKPAEADKLRQAAKEQYAKVTLLTPANPNAAAMRSPERQKLYEYYRAIQEKISAAKKDGNEELVRRLTQELDALRDKLRAQGAAAAARDSTAGGRDARLQYLRAAAENLKAAGCEPEAQHVMDLIRHMEAEVRAQKEAEARAKVGAAAQGYRPAADGQPRARFDPAVSFTHSQVKELQGQIEQMHREIRELREELNRLKGPPAGTAPRN